MGIVTGASLNPQEVIRQIKKVNGNIAAVALALKCSRTTVTAHIRNNPEAKAALDEARETMLDMAESALYNKVLKGSTPELIFFLKTQGKQRGYTEQIEVKDVTRFQEAVLEAIGEADEQTKERILAKLNERRSLELVV